MDSNTKKLEQLVDAYESIKKIDLIKVTNIDVTIEINDPAKRIPTTEFSAITGVIKNSLVFWLNNFQKSPNELVNQVLVSVKKQIELTYANGLTLEEKIKSILEIK